MSATGGVLFLIVGPSGVGKDTLIDAARDRLDGDPAFVFVQRVVTRPAEAGGEAHEAMGEADFRAAEAAGAFMASWQAHGLSYGIRRSAMDALEAGRNVIINGSRGEVRKFARAWPHLVVLSITADPDVVAGRLAARGRESSAAVAARLTRAVPISGAPRVVEIANDGTVEAGTDRFLSAILGAARLPLTLRRAPFALDGEGLALVHRDAYAVAARQLGGAVAIDVGTEGRSVRARLALADDDGVIGRGEVALSSRPFERLGLAEGDAVIVRRARRAESRDVLRKKVAGETLSAGEIERVVRDLVEGRYSEPEVAGFLVAATQGLTLDEVVALTRVRAALGEPLRWAAPLVADKHSMGGIPGSRITLIVVPIVAAYGLIVPKTSSRAITSAAGTADVMECAARVDLTRSELQRVVGRAGAAIAWNGRISQSPLDDVMNAINRPLGIRSAALDVSSILSKKLLAGATHVVIDIPTGPDAKLKTEADAQRLAALFRNVGAGVGLFVEARVTDGSRPVGRAVGPALELCDVEAVLARREDACAVLRDKALDFAGIMLSWDDAVPAGEGRTIAERLLDSGAAQSTFEAIATAQGVRTRVQPGLFSRRILASRGGTVMAINGYAIAGLARAAGAPHDKGAGGRVLAAVGDTVQGGAPLLEIVASSQEGIERTEGLDTEGVFAIA
ncbi:MAG: hypothetical protein AcusKO_17560 [Acuticoccus sp.]